MSICRRGVLQAVLSSLTISICSILVKDSNTPIGQTIFLTNLWIFFCCIPVAIYLKENLFPKGYRLKIIWFGLFSCGTVLADYHAMRLMPLGDESVMSYSSIIFTIILARIFIGETCTRGKIYCSVCIIFGVVFISQPVIASSNYPHYQWGCALSLAGAFFEAFSYVVLKEMPDAGTATVLSNSALTCMIITGPFCFFENWSFPEEPLKISAIAVFTLLHEVFFVLSLSHEEAGTVSLIQASDIVFSYLWEIIFYKETYTVLRIVGAAIVFFSVAYAAITEKKSPIGLLEAKELPLLGRREPFSLRFWIRVLLRRFFGWRHSGRGNLQNSNGGFKQSQQLPGH